MCIVAEDKKAGLKPYFGGTVKDNFVGKAAEYSFSQWLAARSIKCTKDPWSPPFLAAGPYDFISAGKTIDIKGSQVKRHQVKHVYGDYGMLMPTAQAKSPKSEIYVYVLVDDRISNYQSRLEDGEYRDDVRPIWAFPVGWAPAGELGHAVPYTTLRGHACVKLPIALLRTMDGLVTVLEE